jgi:hypothetical protein
MKKITLIPASLLTLVSLLGASTPNASVPCIKANPGDPELICFCGPGGTNCKCRMVARDQNGVETW